MKEGFITDDPVAVDAPYLEARDQGAKVHVDLTQLVDNAAKLACDRVAKGMIQAA